MRVLPHRDPRRFGSLTEQIQRGERPGGRAEACRVKSPGARIQQLAAGSLGDHPGTESEHHRRRQPEVLDIDFLASRQPGEGIEHPCRCARWRNLVCGGVLGLLSGGSGDAQPASTEMTTVQAAETRNGLTAW